MRLFIFNMFFLAYFLTVMYLVFFSEKAKAETYYTFTYKTKDQLKISVPGNDFFEARTKAGKECFRILTRGVYPGQEAGLDYIDICANPIFK